MTKLKTKSSPDMHIVLFGGSFNPPHVGHLWVIRQVFELIPDIDELWLLPTYRHTFDKTLAPASHRLAMCRLLIEALDHPAKAVKLCPAEIDYQTSGETYQTLQLLTSEKQYVARTMALAEAGLTSTRFSFLMGSDQLPAFDRWGNWQRLLEEMHFYVYPRCGHEHPVTYPNMTLLASPTQIITNLSSTLVRQRLTQNLDLHQLLPATLEAYLQQHHLYR